MTRWATLIMLGAIVIAASAPTQAADLDGAAVDDFKTPAEIEWLPGNTSRPHFHPNDRFFVAPKRM